MRLLDHLRPAAAALAASALLLTQAHAADAAAGTVHVLQATAVPSLKGSTTGMGFVEVHNGGSGADRLVGLSSPAATRVELHEMQMRGDVMTMRQLDGIAIGPGEHLSIDGSTLHLMLVGLKQPLTAGDTLPLTLRFEHGGTVTTDMTVRPKAADGHGAAAHDHPH